MHDWRDVDAPCGRVRVYVDGKVIRARGIRYARAQRFAHPVDEPPVETIDGKDPGPGSPQYRRDPNAGMTFDQLGGLPTSEDCLRVSVTMPSEAGGHDSELPVLVWIHGGAYVAGAGDADIYDPHTLVEEQNIIVVSVTYRLGVLGFLGTGKPEHSNLGLLDQISALRWVQRNISAFGGDPSNVTIAGQSAGADSCAHLMIAQATEGLFHRVILASAPLGLAGGTEPMNWAMAKVAEKIDPDASVADILAAQDEVHKAAMVGGLHAGMCFGVHYGDYPLPAKSDTGAAWSEAARKYDVLMTRTEREIAFFAGFVPAFRRLHNRHLTSPMLESLISGITSAVYTRAAKEFYDRHRMSGGQGTRLLIVSRGDGSFFDAAHSGDLPLLFPGDVWHDSFLDYGETAQIAGPELRTIWGRFATSGALPRVPVPGLIDILG
ncbi:carboxylesterase family protein [Brevibacterium aurantiacum]|uniref:Carboxylic ester hydrolase n=1 Tax=Brevibacterium aurantiacum TaxID=273384 RepID=A0A2H1JF81_BREAU|nr:carboxylesterase family protein [Brevibacterium aurantiacum]PCC59031.1 carboxylesterase [Brevibacterium aurantiacum]SMX86073.1 para-nitrobenzyl esterase [Brevibacterium aurantiacum]